MFKVPPGERESRIAKVLRTLDEGPIGRDRAKAAGKLLGVDVSTVGADLNLTHRGCGQNLGLGYAAMPRLSRYSSGLREPREILIRCSLYQRM